MLVLTRKQGQGIVIGDSIEIVVVEVRGDQVRLGIQAPRNVSVLRREILDEIHEENREAAAAGPDVLNALSGLATTAEPGPEDKPAEPKDSDSETGEK